MATKKTWIIVLEILPGSQEPLLHFAEAYDKVKKRKEVACPRFFCFWGREECLGSVLTTKSI
ncbi:MAG: hypothetical protein IK082_09420 [Oscillospiraceae bacterium]|nr:hypothetical protein [Oscillospiraceae bacterium]